LWNPKSGERISVLEGHKSWVNALTFSPDGKLLVSGSSDGTMQHWDMPKGDLHSTFDVTKAEIRSLAFARDGSALATGLRYGDLKVWPAADWSFQQAKVSPGDVWAVAFSKDGKQLFSSDGDWNQPSRVRVSDAQTLKPLGYLQHTGEVLSIAVSPDGKSVAAGSWDKTVRIWNVEKAMKAAE
jgi:WD40 repeat protein